MQKKVMVLCLRVQFFLAIPYYSLILKDVTLIFLSKRSLQRVLTYSIRMQHLSNNVQT